MAAPSFESPVDRTIRQDGSVLSFHLADIPVAGSVSASINNHEHDVHIVDPVMNRLEIAGIIVTKPVEVTIEVVPGEQHPGDPPDKPQTVIENQVVRHTSGAGPIQALPGEDVQILVRFDNLTADFVEKRDTILVSADEWDQIAISARFSREGDVALENGQIDLQARQGEIVTGNMQVRWLSGPPSIVFCSITPRDAGTLQSLALDVSAPRVVVRVGETANVQFTLQIGNRCDVGLFRLDASILGGTEAHSFTINLNVLPAPPPPPSNEANLGSGYVLTREKDMLRLSVDNQTVATVDASNRSGDEQQRQQILDETEENLKQSFKNEGTDIFLMPAAKAGAKLYGAVTAATVGIVLGPDVARSIVGQALEKMGANVGEYYGSIVDTLAAIIKGEEEASVAELAGTMAVLYLTQISPIAPIASAARFLGADGWTLTRELGKKVGEGLEEAINSVGSAIDDVGGTIGDAVDFVTDIF